MQNGESVIKIMFMRLACHKCNRYQFPQEIVPEPLGGISRGGQGMPVFHRPCVFRWLTPALYARIVKG